MKVGFFDSGLGGLTIFKEAIKRLNAEYIYLGDNKNAPYGIKEKKIVKKYIFDNVKFLVENGCEIIVIACNTATSIAIDELREQYPNICIIGTEPAVKKAFDDDLVKRVLVCATSLTISENKLKRLIEKLNGKDKVDFVCLDKLVNFVESEKIESLENIDENEIKKYLKNCLENYEIVKYSHVVLGCTHFPLFKKIFENIFFENVKIIDGSSGVVNNLENKMYELDYMSNLNDLKVELVISKESNSFVNKFKEITGLENFNIVVKK